MLSKEDLEASGSGDPKAPFDPASGSFLERLIFQNRPVIAAACLILTILLGLSARHIDLTASFESMIPSHQPFIVNYEQNKSNLGALSGNTVNIIVRTTGPSILTDQYMTTLRDINDRVFLLPGVDRAYMRSLWTRAVRWEAVTSRGLVGGPVMPDNYDHKADGLAEIDANLRRSGEIGTLVAADYKSSIIKLPLLDIDQATGKPLDYGTLSRSLRQIQAEFANRGVIVGFTGFAMVIGSLLEGMREVLGFFAVSVVIATAMVFWYTRCVRSTTMVVLCSMLAVCWQLGILPLIGYALDPYSVLVPFLVFAIGMSHGAQKMNGVMQDIGRGRPNIVAARMTFRRLFMAGFTALCCDAVGFAVLATIQIPAIQHLAIIASIGVAILIFTNLILLPLTLSYIGVSRTAAARSLVAGQASDQGLAKHPLWALMDLFTQRRYAAIAILTATVMGLGGLYFGRALQVGDIDAGAPELRSNSAYNRDDAYFVAHYATSSDIFAVMVKTPMSHCADFRNLIKMDQLEQQVREIPGVTSTSSFAGFERILSVQLNEGSYAWYDLTPNQASLNQAVTFAPVEMVNATCDFMPISMYLKDHKAGTLTQVVDTVQRYADRENSPDIKFLMAGGNAGIEAATNLVVEQSSRTMLFEVYAAVIVLSLLTFRSWRAVVIAVLPLILTSILAQALMVELGIGVKVATLPVTALGVGIGLDYALYILSVMLANLRSGMDLSEAYYRALLFTGKVVMLTGFTLAAAVSMWVFSPIKFQADMGELLAFMFLLNMVGALILLPALSCFLLPSKRVRLADSMEVRTQQAVSATKR